VRAAGDTFSTYDVSAWTGVVIFFGAALAGHLVGKHLVAHVKYLWSRR
jgi:hypothetical protein